MLNRLLLAADLLLVLAIGGLSVHLYRVWTTDPASAGPMAGDATAAAPQTPAASPKAGPPPPLSAFTVVAERNLFSPTRTESGPEPPRPTTASLGPTPAAPKPRLYGVVLSDGTARAYLEDPRTRKVFGYVVGDSVADSRVEQIRTDRVVLRRGGEVYEVLLHDPTKPKPGAPAAAGRPVQPTMPQPGMPQMPGGFPVAPGAPGAAGVQPYGLQPPQVPAPGQGEEGEEGVVPTQPAPPPAASPPFVGPRRPPLRQPGGAPGPSGQLPAQPPGESRS